jgi:type VI secretion system protein ImpA
MSDLWESRELLQPISADRPCGENLEDTPLLASFDEFRLYGRTKPLEPTSESGEGGPKTLEDKDERPPEWPEIKSRSLDALSKSKDLRLLVHLGTALLRTDGLPAFVETVNVAAQWLEDYWDQTFPPVDGDGILRRSALNCFADPIAVIDALRRVPIVRSRQHGSFSLRELDSAPGQSPGPSTAQASAAFGEMPLEDLTGLEQRVANALKSLKTIDGKMRENVGTEAAPTFDLLSTQLTKIDRVLRSQLSARTGSDEGLDDGEQDKSGGRGGVVPVGVIRSREDAVRTLDAVAEFFRKNEPSSPVPLFCDRAKRLIAKDFLEVLADVAPEALGSARAAGGVRGE